LLTSAFIANEDFLPSTSAGTMSTTDILAIGTLATGDCILSVKCSIDSIAGMSSIESD
jgi:hypothetical protein